MSRTTPRQKFLYVFLSVFLLSCFACWFSSLYGGPVFLRLIVQAYDIEASIWPPALCLSLLLSLTAAFVVWVCASLSQLRFENAALRSELERLKNKE